MKTPPPPTGHTLPSMRVWRVKSCDPCGGVLSCGLSSWAADAAEQGDHRCRRGLRLLSTARREGLLRYDPVCAQTGHTQPCQCFRTSHFLLALTSLSWNGAPHMGIQFLSFCVSDFRLVQKRLSLNYATSLFPNILLKKPIFFFVVVMRTLQRLLHCYLF